MSYEVASLAVFISTAILWLIAAIQCNQLRICFLDESPEDAPRFVTPPGYRSPKNVTFLFRQQAVDLLRRNPKLWQMRQRAVCLLGISLVWPVLGMTTLAVMISQAQ